MGYYNEVQVVFAIGDQFNGELGVRDAGQILPKGSIPIAILNYNQNVIVEIINSRNKEEILYFFKNLECSKDGTKETVPMWDGKTEPTYISM